ncbi:MAG: hypothetical protein RLZZ127_1914, partial [Planctomycetota bacterium]
MPWRIRGSGPDMVDAPVTPQQAAWTAFRRKPSVRIGLGLLVVAALVAVYAPFLSSEACLIWHDEAGWSSPLLRELF